MLALSTAASGQDWPTRPVTMVVPFAAGGAVDVVGRIVAPRMSEILGQQIIIENVGGAGGMVGSNRVAKGSPDGYQFVFATQGTHAFNQSLYKKPLYDAASDFAPVSVVTETQKVLVTRKDFPAGTLAEFIAYAKANPGKLQYGSAGAGSATHVSCMLFNSVIGADATHIPYRGATLALQDLIAGRIDYICDVLGGSLPQIEANAVKALAVLSGNRNPALPNVASAREQGLVDFDVDSWNAFFFPKGTAERIVRRLNTAANVALDTLTVRARLEAIGASVPPPERRTSDHLAKLVRSEIEKWAAPIKAGGILVD